MHQLKAIAYVSSQTAKLTEEDLEALLRDARDHNADAGVTGVLLYDEGTFFQYIEGPEQGMARVYQRILRASQHKDVTELLNEPLSQRHFGDWYMGFSRAPKSAILRLEQAVWKQVLTTDVAAGQDVGIRLLKTFWATANRLHPDLGA